MIRKMVSKQSEQKLKNVIRLIKSPVPKRYKVKIIELSQSEIMQKYGAFAEMKYSGKNIIITISPRASEKVIAHEFAHLIWKDQLSKLFKLRWSDMRRGKQWSAEEDFARTFESVYGKVKSKRKVTTMKEKVIKDMFF